VSLWLRFAVPVRSEPVRVAARPSSLAVLPFVNTNPDSADDYLGYGFAAELTRALDRLPGLSVAARSSAFGLQGRGEPPRTIGRRLNVGTVLEGSIRRAGERLRVTTHLVDVNEGFDLWSDTYEREAGDLLAVQREIERAIAGALRIPITEDSASAPRQPTGNPAAYDAYLAGTYLLDQPGPDALREAVAYLNRAIRLDSSFALAHAALAEAYLPAAGREELPPRVAMPRAEAAALQALKLDSTLAEAHSTLGAIRFLYYRDWRGAESELRRAIAMDPGSAEAQHAYSHFLLAMGRSDESLEKMEKAVQLSPEAPSLGQHLGWHYLHARRYPEARKSLARAIELDSTAWRAHFDLALLEQTAGNYDQALGHLKVPLLLEPEHPAVQLALGQIHALSGRTDEARAILERLQADARQRYISPYLIGCLQAVLGQRVQAFASLDRAVRQRSALVPYLRIDPRLDPLRTDRRFSRLLRQVRLP
jgi:TolB-like protein/Tfp pilus assembly protein PilF